MGEIHRFQISVELNCFFGTDLSVTKKTRPGAYKHRALLCVLLVNDRSASIYRRD